MWAFSDQRTLELSLASHDGRDHLLHGFFVGARGNAFDQVFGLGSVVFLDPGFDGLFHGTTDGIPERDLDWALGKCCAGEHQQSQYDANSFHERPPLQDG